MRDRRRPRSLASAAVAVAGLGLSVLLVALLARQVAVERDRAARSSTDERGVRNQLHTVQAHLKETRREAALVAENRAREAVVADAEIAALRRDLSLARKERETWRERYRAAASERDRAADELLAARRDIDLLRDDVARAAQRSQAAVEGARSRDAELEEARRRLAATTDRVRHLLRPLLQDLRSPDGSIRVRAHEALCAYAGREFPYRSGGTAEEREADATAIEGELMGK